MKRKPPFAAGDYVLTRTATGKLWARVVSASGLSITVEAAETAAGFTAGFEFRVPRSSVLRVWRAPAELPPADVACMAWGWSRGDAS